MDVLGPAALLYSQHHCQNLIMTGAAFSSPNSHLCAQRRGRLELRNVALGRMETSIRADACTSRRKLSDPRHH